jgi:UDP-N-acetylmuramate dehydrogenase
MNAGAWGKSIADVVDEVTLLDYHGEMIRLKKRDIAFDYRTSGLSRYIIIGARFKLKRRNKREIAAEMNTYLEMRKKSQDVSLPSAGCVFKNPKGRSAGELIDACGLKGRSIGNARISSKHANFILNCGHASSNDILTLMALIKRDVRRRFSVPLQPEVKIWQ